MSRDRTWPLVVWLSLLAVTGLRFAHLEADTPASLESESMAAFVDEGYKTLGPRNLVLFGRLHWNDTDDYVTWMRQSPLTQWLYFASFEVFGAELWAARLVTILFFVGLLLGFVLACWTDYGTPLLVAGLLALGINQLLFFYSRLAVFEVPVLASLYGLLFLLRARDRFVPRRDLICTLLILSVAALGIKPSALAYFGPVVIALLARTFRSGAGRRSPWILSVGVLLGVGTVALITHNLWISRLSWEFEVVRTALLNSLTSSSGLVVASGLLCLVHLGVCRPEAVFENTYRLCLASLIVLGTIFLAFAQPSPQRYWVPLLPACFLFVWEWLSCRAWRMPLPRKSGAWTVGFALVGLSWAILILGQVLDDLVRRFSGAPIGIPARVEDLAGFGASPRFIVAVTGAVILGALLWRSRRRMLKGRAVLGVVAVLLGGSVVRDAAAVGRFLAWPSFRSREIAAGLETVIADDESVAGDWAPFFALGTGIRALYMTSQFNHPVRIGSLRPDYFLFCDAASGDGRVIRRLLEQSTDVQLGPPLFRSGYVGGEVILYRLDYPPGGEG